MAVTTLRNGDPRACRADETASIGAAFVAFRDSGTRSEKVIFALGVVIFLSVQSAFVLVPIWHRDALVEPDDAYSYIIKGVEIKTCFRQDCPALNDLRPQLALPVPDDRAAFERYRQYHRLFSFYSPLHAALLAALHSTGLSWESAYNGILVVGFLFMALVTAAWLFVMWGAAPAGVALLLLTVHVFPGYSLIRVVPGNLALGIAMLTWTAVLRKGAAAWWVVLLGVAAMLAMHPIGRFYAAVTILLYVILSVRSRPLWVVGVAVGGVLPIAFTFVLPLIVSRPEFRIIDGPIPSGWTQTAAIKTNIVTASAMVAYWIGLSRENFMDVGLVFTDFLFLLIAGFLIVPSGRRRKILVMATLLVPLLAADLLLLHPRYPAVIFARVWIPLAILLSGALGQAGSFCLLFALAWIKRLVGVRAVADQKASVTANGHGWLVLLFALMALIGCRYVLYSSQNKLDRVKTEWNAVLRIQDISLDPRQPAVLTAKAGPADRVLYTDEASFYFFLVHGAMKLGAVYYPAIRGTADEGVWLHETKNIRFVAGINPLCKIPLATGKGLALWHRQRLEVRRREPGPLGSVALRLYNPGGETVLRILPLDSPTTGTEKPVCELRVPADFDGWLSATTQTTTVAHRFAIEAAGTRPIYLKGIRVAAESALNWPWDQGISLIYRPSKDEAIEASFSSEALCPRLSRSLEILADGGSTVLAKVRPE